MKVHLIKEKVSNLTFARVIKVNEVEALSFDRKQYRKYSRKFPALKEGENYNGYVIVNYGRGRYIVAVLNGSLVKTIDGNVTKYEQKSGELHRVQTFGDCSFEDTIGYLQDRGALARIMDAEKCSEELCRKLVTASIKRNEELILSQDELLILREHFGNEFNKFAY